MNPRRTPSVKLAAVAAVVAVSIAACGGTGSSPTGTASAAGASIAGTLWTPSTASDTPATSPSLPEEWLPSPRSTVDPNWPGYPLPDGVTSVDAASSIDALNWSPDGQLLVVVTSGGVVGTGRIDVLDVSGKRLASFSATSACWVDSAHLMTLAVTPEDIGTGMATLRSVDGSESSAIPGQFGGVTCSEHGLVALRDPLSGEGPAGFRIWSNGALGAEVTGRGLPVDWSPDGQYLALLDWPLADGRGAAALSAPGIRWPRADVANHAILPSTGSSGPVAARVMRFPDQKIVVSGVTVYGPGTVATFAPDSRSIALFPTSSKGRGVVASLPGGAETPITAGRPIGWAPDGRLVLVDNGGKVLTWTPSGTRVVPDASFDVEFGPATGDVATVARNTDPLGSPKAVIRHAGKSAEVPLTAPFISATWSSDGVCFISTGTTDAQTESDHLLRVDLR